ncbi:MAG: hypothetical protein ACPGWR_27680 [Ardenticatenaceae bacterium]
MARNEKKGLTEGCFAHEQAGEAQVLPPNEQAGALVIVWAAPYFRDGAGRGTFGP